VSFARFAKLRLRAWLRECQDDGRPMPGDRAIATKLEFGSVSLVPNILEEMARDGMIALEIISGERSITVLDHKEQGLASARTAPPKAPTPAAERLAPPAPAAAPVKPPVPQPQSSPGKAAKVQAEVPPQQEVAAAAPEIPEAHPMAVVFERGRKPRIRAAVIREAKSREIPLDTFVSDLIDLGLAQFLRVEAAAAVPASDTATTGTAS
jgi:hypothetical protein